MDMFTPENITKIYQAENHVNSKKPQALTELQDGQKSNSEN